MSKYIYDWLMDIRVRFPPFDRCHEFINKIKEIFSVAFALYATAFLSFFYYPSLLCVIDTN